MGGAVLALFGQSDAEAKRKRKKNKKKGKTQNEKPMRRRYQERRRV